MSQPARDPDARATDSTDIALERLAIGLLMLVFAVVAALTPAQNDTFWQLRMGEDIWRTGELPRVDAYSHTARGAAWKNHEWLSQVAMYLTWRVGGMPGLELGATALIMATVLLMHRLMVGPGLARFVLMGAGLAVSSCVWVLRPHLVSLVGIALLLTLLVRRRDRWIPPLFVLWANAHGGVALGGLVLVAAVAAAGWRWQRTRADVDWRRLRGLAIVSALSGIATVLTPLGPGIADFLAESAVRSAGFISEWRATSPTEVVGAMFWVLVLGFAAALVARRRVLADASFEDLVCLATAVVLFPLAVRSVRNIAPFLIAATVAASRVLGPEFRFRLPVRWQSPARPIGASRPAPVAAVLAVLAAAAAVAVVLAWKRELPVLGWRPIGDGAIAAVRSCPGPLYNRYDEGGFLIWFAREQPVFIDGRQEPYPIELVHDVIALERGGSHHPLFDRWRIRCAFLPAAVPLAARLRAEGWLPSFEDRRWTVLVKPEPG